MKKILYIIGSLEVGGAEQHLTKVAVSLKALGWSPEFFIFKIGGPLTLRLNEAGIPIHSPLITKRFWCLGFMNFSDNRFLRAFFLILAMMKLMRTKKYDCIHFFLPMAYILGGIAAILTFSGPRVMSRRSLNDYQKKNAMYLMVEKFLHSRMDMICANSAAVMKQLVSEGIPKNKLSLIYNGIDIERFDLEINSSFIQGGLDPNKDSFILIIVANLIPYKGHKDLLRALSLIKKDLPECWQCLCVGRDDGYGGELKSLSTRLNLGSHIKWLGSRSDIPKLLRASDVAILCSHEEGFSNAILEAMAAGLPVIATDVGGNSEAVVPGITGELIPPKNPEELGRTILTLLDPLKRNKYGVMGRRRVIKLFLMDKAVESYQSLYRDLINF